MMAKRRHRTRQLLKAIRPGLRAPAPLDTGPADDGTPASSAGRSPPRRAWVTGTGSPPPDPPKEPPEAAGPWPAASPPPFPGPPFSGPPPPFSGRPEDGDCAPFPLVVGRLRTALTPRSFKGITKRVRTYNHQPAPPHRAFGGNHRELSQRSTCPPWRCPPRDASAPGLDGPGNYGESHGARGPSSPASHDGSCVPGGRPAEGSARDRGTTNVHARGTTPSPSVSGCTVFDGSGLGGPGRRRPYGLPPNACRGIDLPRSVRSVSETSRHRGLETYDSGISNHADKHRGEEARNTLSEAPRRQHEYAGARPSLGIPLASQTRTARPSGTSPARLWAEPSRGARRTTKAPWETWGVTAQLGRPETAVKPRDERPGWGVSPRSLEPTGC